jgi:opacity protein-like surface antigen
MKRLIALCIATGILSLGSVSFAQEKDDSSLVSKYGVAAFIGGGVGGFVEQDMRDIAGTAGLWEARFELGSRLPASIEVAYLGGLQPITNTLGIDKDALLMSNGAELTLRGNLPIGPMTSYVFAGVGWTRFDLANYDTNTSSVEDSDNVVTIPVGLGVAYRYEHFLADLRGVYRPTFNEDLVPDKTNSSDHLNLDSWSVALHGGFEF